MVFFAVGVSFSSRSLLRMLTAIKLCANKLYHRVICANVHANNLWLHSLKALTRANLYHRFECTAST